MKQFVSILTFSLFVLSQNVSAQTFLGTLRKSEAGKGTVTVQQSTAIDALVNGKAPVSNTTPASVGKTATSTMNHGVTSPNNHTDNIRTENPNATSASPSAGTSANDVPGTDVTVDTRKKVMRNSYKMNGYRIQVFSGGNSRADRQKAEQIGADLKRLFPNQPIYVHFYSPSWKCRMGNFKSQGEAQTVLKQVKVHYNQACLIKGPISVQY